MKTFIRNLAIGLAIGLPLVLVVAAGTHPAEAQKAFVQIVSTATDLVAPVPSPTSTPTPVVAPVEIPTPIPTVIPTPPTSPPEPTSFPVNPPQLVVPTPGATPITIQAPQTNVFIGIVSVNGHAADERGTPFIKYPGDDRLTSYGGYGDGGTGGVGGPGPLTIVYQANFQGGFSGVTPTFTWSNGQTGASVTITYSTAGQFRETVKASEVYQGVTYAVGGANSVPITVT